MYIEDKSDQLVGPARIGRVTFSKTGKSLYYKGKTFQSLSGNGFKANYFDVESGDHYWISGPKKDGEDGLLRPEAEAHSHRRRCPRRILDSHPQKTRKQKS
jgi:hypothetical protein